MPKRSAGLLLYRRAGDGVKVLLVHPGGPFFAHKDKGVWSIPKGEYEPGDDPLAAALREFDEETGTRVASDADLIYLGEIKQRGGKVVTAWAAEGDLDADAIISNTFEMEWPPRSGRMQEFPEVDRAAWLTIDEARDKIVPAQVPLLERLLQALS